VRIYFSLFCFVGVYFSLGLFLLENLYSRNNLISLSVRINFVCANLLLDISTQQLVAVVLTFCG